MALPLKYYTEARARVRSIADVEIRMPEADEKLHPVTITINGVRRTVSVEPRKLLVHLIRDDLDLTGTHIGCDTSQCGAPNLFQLDSVSVDDGSQSTNTLPSTSP